MQIKININFTCAYTYISVCTCMDGCPWNLEEGIGYSHVGDASCLTCIRGTEFPSFEKLASSLNYSAIFSLPK